MSNQWSHETAYGQLGKGGNEADIIRGFDGQVELATPSQRLLAGVIDYSPLWITSLSAGLLAAVGWDWAWWVPLSILSGGLLLIFANSVIMQGITGQSFAKRLLGLAAYRKKEFPSGWACVVPGVGVSLVRFAVHIAEWLMWTCVIGFLAPFVPWLNKSHKTIGDFLTDTYVAKRRTQIRYRR